MYKFSNLSEQRLNGVAEPLQKIIRRAMDWQVMDFTVICGLRSLEEQKQLVSKGFSRTLNSRHLANKNGYSEAVDIAPYPINWNDTHAFHRLAGIIQASAASFNIDIRWGGDWDRDNDTNDQSFIDLPHFELVL
jgi:peptidoglycan L-alanyl-D-glutamate endopeptidase CwlK